MKIPVRADTSLTDEYRIRAEAETALWQSRAHDLILQNDLLRLSVDILRAELTEEKSKHGSV